METTTKTTEKRDFVAFVSDASKEDSDLGIHFIGELNKEGVTAADLHKLLISWSYVDVGLEDLTKVLTIFKGSEKAQGVTMKTGYNPTLHSIQY